MNRLPALLITVALITVVLGTAGCSSPSKAEMIDRIIDARGSEDWTVGDNEVESYLDCVLTGMGEDAATFTDLIVDTADAGDDEFVAGLKDDDLYDRFLGINPDCLRSNGAVGVDG